LAASAPASAAKYIKSFALAISPSKFAAISAIKYVLELFDIIF
jgi:hypothetical protein